ncbi:ABC transporter ATP-binding protein [Kitasatospora aureofaciens]|uniref:ABC transporter n=1 Tax=Kitasatospora aureofaciens TaxID=1894 RepID=A0A1E7MVZ6_KITAU|nr:ABC transporter ATP-binding protein [Kitasatospora aureofaciens]QEU99570.1 ABC transporter ATP-binding protein [Streptomyces viridifaciens]ARF78354.1 ABC transporter [Kitasatospora aureofaciens]OEV32606.1 ABC transporter [Kitasatospora aureofaciens]UKZ05668.1 ABC transporter ATP-binding protein [Streptomyces viridifaciens]GGU79773.1 ABC transporter [Kitasatospora aureofaciens]
MAHGQWAVELRSVEKKYGRGAGEVAALRDLSLSFDRGSFTAVMGPSGAGKSTFLHCAAGLDRPTSGSVWLAGTDLATLDEAQLTMLRRERVGFIFQAYNLLGSLTVAENITLPLLLAGVAAEPGWLDQVARRVGLSDRLQHRPAQLSGGQQQRVAIARALITKPEVIFADEPTGALDSRTGRQVLSLLREIVDRDGNTVVMVTHDPVAASFAQRVVFLADGAFAEEMAAPTADRVAARMTRLEEW